MVRKNYVTPVVDSPVIIFFAAVSAAVFLLDALFFKGSLVEKAFVCRGAKAAVPFDFSSPMDYIRILTCCFGCLSWDSFFTSLIFILLLGPALEEKYGSAMLALMFFITSLVGGVLTASLSSFNLTGPFGIIFMLIILAALSAFMKGQVPVSWIFIFVLYLSLEFYKNSPEQSTGFSEFLQSKIPVFIHLASGICGSLFGFFVAPKNRAPRKKAEKKTSQTGSNGTDSGSSDETVIGNIIV